LVFSTIHTNDSAGAVTRLIDMGIEPFLVASSISALLAQRLVRRLCGKCREAYVPTPEELDRIGIPQGSFFGSPEGRMHIPKYKQKLPLPPPGMLYRARQGGCAACNKAGYAGRSAIYELLLIDDEIRALALRKADAGSIKRAALAAGMRTLRGDGAFKVMSGITSVEEVMLVTAEDQG
jgi:general secretion pathway protein E